MGEMLRPRAEMSFTWIWPFEELEAEGVGADWV